MRIGRVATVSVLVIGGAFALLAPARALRRELLVGRALDALCTALDSRLARTGVLPDRLALGGGELARLLHQDGDLPTLPRNPDTGQPFGVVDLETDLFFFEVVRGGGGYRIEVLDVAGRDVVAVRVGPSR